MRVAAGQCRSQGRTKPPTAQSGAKLKGLSAGQQALDRSSHPLRRSVKHNPGQKALFRVSLVFDVLTSTFLKFIPIVLEIGQLRCHAES